MAIRHVRVNQTQEEQLKNSERLIRDCIAKKENEQVIPKRLLFELNEMLEDSNTNTVAELQVKKLDRETWAVTTDQITIDPKCFHSWTPRKVGRDAKGKKLPKDERPPRLTAVLLHELVHFAGGEELDAEFFENRLFTEAEGAIAPTETDKEVFKFYEYKGRFIQLDPETRKVTELGTGHLLGELPLPPEPVPDPLKPDTRAIPGGDIMEKNDQQEQLAKLKIQKMGERKNQVGVRIVVEITGYIKKSELGSLLDGIKRNVTPHVEGNGGGG